MSGKSNSSRKTGIDKLSRIESLEAREDRLWGTYTSKSLRFFTCDEQGVPDSLNKAMALVKKSCALANRELGLLPAIKSDAIAEACDELIFGEQKEQIVVDTICGGYGIGLSLNFDEVLAKRATTIIEELSRHSHKSPPRVHPRDSGLSHSYIDAFSSAARISAYSELRLLLGALVEFERLLRRKSLEFERFLKTGRLSHRLAAPMTLGQEFNVYGACLERAWQRLKDRGQPLLEINLGSGFIGTGLDTHHRFPTLVTGILRQNSGLDLKSSEDPMRINQSMGDFSSLSSALKELSLELIRICSDLRLLSSDSLSGPAELRLPTLFKDDTVSQDENDQISDPENTASISAMDPPKLEIPPLTEQMIMLCHRVQGNDLAISLASQSGQLEANSTLPLIIDRLLDSLKILRLGLRSFCLNCLARITADQSRCKESFENSEALLKALAREIGWEKAQEACSRAGQAGFDLKAYLLDTKLIPRASLERIYHHKLLTTPPLTESSQDAE